MENQEEEILEVVPEIVYLPDDKTDQSTPNNIATDEASETHQEEVDGVNIQYAEVVENDLIPCEYTDDTVTYYLLPNMFTGVKEEISESDPDASNSKSVCVLCGAESENYFQNLEHFKEAHETSELMCVICGAKTKTAMALMRHYERHRYSCEICSASYSKLQSLNDHKKTHLSMPYACNKCGAAFESTKDITVHIREVHKRNGVELLKAEPGDYDYFEPPLKKSR